MQSPILVLSSSPPRVEICATEASSLVKEQKKSIEINDWDHRTTITRADLHMKGGCEEGRAQKRRKTEDDLSAESPPRDLNEMPKPTTSPTPLGFQKDIWEIPSSSDNDTLPKKTKVKVMAPGANLGSRATKALSPLTPKVKNLPNSPLTSSPLLMSPSAILRSIVTVPKCGHLNGIGGAIRVSGFSTAKDKLRKGKDHGGFGVGKKDDIEDTRDTSTSSTTSIALKTKTNPRGTKNGAKPKATSRNGVVKRTATVSSHFTVSKLSNNMSSKASTGSITSIDEVAEVQIGLTENAKENEQAAFQFDSPGPPAIPRRRDWTPVKNTKPIPSTASVIGFDLSSQPLQKVPCEIIDTPTTVFRNSVGVLKYNTVAGTDSIDAPTNRFTSEGNGTAFHEPDNVRTIDNGMGVTRRRNIELLDRPNMPNIRRDFATSSTCTVLKCAASSNKPDTIESKATRPTAKRKAKAQTVTIVTKPHGGPEVQSSASCILEYLSPAMKSSKPSPDAGHRIEARKVARKPGTKAIVKKTKKLLKEDIVLLSPESAIKQASEQVLVFGTSSQLLQEDYSDDENRNSRTLEEFLKEQGISMSPKQKRMFMQFGSGGNASSSVSENKNLWTAGARNLDGELMQAEMVDLSNVSRSSPGISRCVSCDVPDVPEVRYGENASLNLAETSLSVTSPTRPLNDGKSASKSPCRPKSKRLDKVDMHSVVDTIDLTQTPIPVTKKNTPRKRDKKSHNLGHESTIGLDCPTPALPNLRLDKHFALTKQSSPVRKPPGAAVPFPQLLTTMTENIVRKPAFENFSTNELKAHVSKYGFRPANNRARLIEILEKCWDGEQKSKEAVSTDKINDIEEQIEKAKQIKPTGKGKGGMKTATRKATIDSTTYIGAARTASFHKRLSTVLATELPENMGDTIPNSESEAESITSARSRAHGKTVSPSTSQRRLGRVASPNPNARTKSNHRTQKRMKSKHSGTAKSTAKAKQSASKLPDEAYFPLITHTILSQPKLPIKTDQLREGEPQMTWHERILMYEPLVLERLCAWLNSPEGILKHSKASQFRDILGSGREYSDSDNVGVIGDSQEEAEGTKGRKRHFKILVTPEMVKTWAEAKGVCVCNQERGR